MKRDRVELECQACGKRFEVMRSRAARSKTCSKACSYEIKRKMMLGNKHALGNKPNSGAFVRGQAAWNKGIPGPRNSRATEFKPGVPPKTKLPLGSVTIRTTKRTGEQRAFVKVAEPNVWRLRALIAWELVNGPLPKGMLVHHEDRNTLNDSPVNLKAITRAEHLLEHRPEFEARRRAALRQKRKTTGHRS